MLTLTTPSLVLHSSSVRRSRLVAYSVDDCLARRLDQVGVADDGDAVAHHGLAGLGEFAVAALLGRHVDDHAAGLHALHHLGGDQLGRRLARDQRGGDDDVASLACSAYIARCAALEALAHHLGVAAAAGAFFLVVDLDELAAQRLDLVGHLGAVSLARTMAPRLAAVPMAAARRRRRRR